MNVVLPFLLGAYGPSCGMPLVRRYAREDQTGGVHIELIEIKQLASLVGRTTAHAIANFFRFSLHLFRGTQDSFTKAPEPRLTQHNHFSRPARLHWLTIRRCFDFPFSLHQAAASDSCIFRLNCSSLEEFCPSVTCAQPSLACRAFPASPLRPDAAHLTATDIGCDPDVHCSPLLGRQDGDAQFPCQISSHHLCLYPAGIYASQSLFDPGPPPRLLQIFEGPY